MSCNNSNDKQANVSNKKVKYKIECLAETPQDLQTPESVVYFPAKDILFVSNINGKPTEKDKNGFISIIDKNGKIIDLHWADGLNAPKGMTIIDSFLYVTDIDRIVKINISDGKITKIYNVENAVFLNDITEHNRILFFTDMAENKVYSLENNKVNVLIDSDLTSPNGITTDDNFLYIGNSGYILAYNFNTQEVEQIAKTQGMTDGLKIFANGFLVSDWKSKIFFVDKENITELADISLQNIADFEFIPADSLLFLPTFSGNTVKICKIR